MSFRVLLVYPNLRGMNMLPPAIGLLSAVLKRSGFTVKLFDTTYYEKLDDAHAEADSDAMKVDIPKEFWSDLKNEGILPDHVPTP